MADRPLRVVVWNEFWHETRKDDVRAIYPDGIHTVLADAIGRAFPGATVTTATQDQPEHGLPEELVRSTDVMLWWGHARHDHVEDAIVDRVHRAVLEGMGLVVLHSGHASKIFRRLMGTGCMLRWRVAAERERLWVVRPGHEILDGLSEPYFEIHPEEMYGEHFDIPEPDETLLVSWFEGGEVFRSACTWHRGKGRIFYFRPGHETYPTYYDANVRRIIAGGVRWAAPRGGRYDFDARKVEPPLSPVNRDPAKP